MSQNDVIASLSGVDLAPNHSDRGMLCLLRQEMTSQIIKHFTVLPASEDTQD